MTFVAAARFRSDRPPGNPFATRFTRPGAVPPLDRDGRPLDVAALAARLHELGAAAIVGPHGHGKTTLLVAIADTVATAGRPVRMVRARCWADVRLALAAVAGSPAGTLVCIDGWEALGPGRWLVRHAARSLGRPLLVTCHGPAGLPVLQTCATTEVLLAAIVARLPDHGDLIGTEAVATAFGRHGGNLRESLAELYDQYERTATPRVASRSG